MESNNQGQQPVRQSLGDGGKQKSTAAIIGILVGIAVVLLVVNGILKKDRSVKNEKVNEPTNTNQPVVIDNTNQPPEVITTTVDTSDWKRYRNKDIGFELKYPANWRVDESDSNVDIYSADYKMGLSVSIESTNKTLEQFVNEYNNLDQTSRILEEKEITISDSVPATKLKASTSLGIDSTYIYISYNSKRYLIRYYEFDGIHSEIVSSFRLLSENTELKIYENKELGIAFKYPANFYLLNRINEFEQSILISDEKIVFNEFLSAYFAPITIAKSDKKQDGDYINLLLNKTEKKMIIDGKNARLIEGTVPEQPPYQKFNTFIVVIDEVGITIKASDVRSFAGGKISFDLKQVLDSILSTLKFN